MSGKGDEFQMFLDFEHPAEKKSVPSAEVQEQAEKPQVDSVLFPEIRRALLAWILSQKPSGLACSVPVRISKYRADIAAFWSVPGKRKHLTPEMTVLIEIRDSRDLCWPDCGRKEELLPLLRAEKDRKLHLQAEIRNTEPKLKDSDGLFEDCQHWNYEKSTNRAYHKCLRKIEEIEHSLYKGSRFEQIRRAGVADKLYLAVPENVVHPHELADGWGLLYVSGRNVTLVKEADDWDCSLENRLHLIQNIASAASRDVLFANGLSVNPDGVVKFKRIPKRRRS